MIIILFSLFKLSVNIYQNNTYFEKIKILNFKKHFGTLFAFTRLIKIFFKG